MHHRFGVGDGVVVVVDEWETQETFQQFSSAPELQQLVAEMGASPDLSPDVTISEAITTSDQF